MDPTSIFDFSSILNAGQKQDPSLGSLGTFGGVSDPFASNPFMFTPGASNFAQAGFFGNQLGGSILSGGGFSSMLGGSTDMLQMLAQVQAQQKALDNYIKLDAPDPSLVDQAKKISAADETLVTKDEAAKISQAGEDVATKDEAKKISDAKED